MIEYNVLEEKWKKRWNESKLFEANAKKGKKKFFATFPYPYMNSLLHIGHFYTLMRVEALCRYKRLQGYNVLFPQGWHCTGSPIEAAAQRIREGEPKQISNMKKLGLSDSEIAKFSEPQYWTEYFPKEAKLDYERMGLGVDFRRSFITTSLNPYYNAFIEWQFNHLKEKGLVAKGVHPVVWDPIKGMPVGDHDRSEGEGEVPQEFLLVRHKLDDGRFVISATLRQDTILGITNLYVHPNIEYDEIEIETTNDKDKKSNREIWIVGDAASKRLEEQDWKIKRKGKVKGLSLVGQFTEEFGGRRVPILPATFIDPEFGTGLVHSVPSDSADDLIALWDLQKDEKFCKKYGLDIEMIRNIKPIPILDTEGIGDIPAEHFLKKYNIKNQNERKKLDEIKKELYKLSFYAARFGKVYNNIFSKDISGKLVQDEKEFVKDELKRLGWIETYYQLTGKVVSRSLNICTVKIVRDQWFMNYSDPSWKDSVRQALENLTLYPEKSRSQFEYVVGWIQNWACTREYGLGTKLPWERQWVIESLSDSTIYMAFYTIAHLIKEIPKEELCDEVFDYVFGKSVMRPILKSGKAKEDILDRMREEFSYWYPVNFRNSGKDLIQNHLVFYLFNHVALFEKKHWPSGIGVNGWVTVDGQKMSKSLGNMILLRDMAVQFGVDPSRLTILNGGEGLDDPNWDSDFAKNQNIRLGQFCEFCINSYNTGSDKKTSVDDWMQSKLNQLIKETTECMELTLFRSGIQKAYFELSRATRWYLRRTNNSPNKKVMNQIIESQLVLMSPFTPFICEEAWEGIGKKGFISEAKWPEYDESKIDEELNKSEDIIAGTMDDITTVLKLTNKISPKKITIFVAEEWKHDVFRKIKEIMKETRVPDLIIRDAMKDEKIKKYGDNAVKMIPLVVKGNKVPETVYSQDDEYKFLNSSIDFLKKTFNTEITVIKEIDASDEQTAKARQALPGKCALFVE